MNEPYKILIQGGSAEQEMKKSRFIANVAVATCEEEALEFIGAMRKKYYDARHNCFAYIIGKDGDKVKYSDDGEPSQTAGLPIYNVLRESGIRNAVVVVTRYFGGTLLGAGPLARMYLDTAKCGLEACKTAMMRYGVLAGITSDYSDAERIKRYLDGENVDVVDIMYGAAVEIHMKTGFDNYEHVKKDIISLTASRAKIEKITETYFIDKE